MTRRYTLSTLLTASILMVTMTAGPANAEEAEAERLSRHIAKVAPDQGRVLPLRERGNAIRAKVAGITATIPTNPDGAIVLDSATDAQPVEVSLPEEVNVGRGRVTHDGTMVYQGRDVDAAVQILADGSVRAQTIIHTTTAPHRFTYDVGEGYTAALADDGQAALIPTDSTAQTVVGLTWVDAAWAVDANGAPVPTHYELGANGELVQIVEPTAETAYPVVADPRWRWYAAAYGAKLNKYETRRAREWGYAAFLCAAGGPVGPVCAFMIGYVTAQATWATKEGNCIMIATVPPGIILRYRDRDCY